MVKGTGPLSLLLSLIAAAAAIAAGPTVRSVTVSGNRAIGEQKIILLLKTRPGTEFSEDTIRDDVRRLAETGYFADVSYSTAKDGDAVAVTVAVKENPVVVSVSFTGNRELAAKDLAAIFKVAAGDVYSEAKAADGAAAIRKRYEEKGFPVASVSHSAEPKDGGVAVTVVIGERSRGYVKSLAFKGNASYPASVLLKQMKTRARSLPRRRGAFKRETYEKDLEALTRFYRKNGFLDMKIAASEPVPAGPDAVAVVIAIEEGARYSLGTVTFSGDVIFDEETLRGAMPATTSGAFLDEEKLEGNIAALRKLYHDAGYIRTQVSAWPKPAAGRRDALDMTYEIVSGRSYTVDEVRITGNVRTKDKVIRRQLKLGPGDPFSGEGVTRSFNNLRDLNYFDNVTIVPEQTGEPDKADLVVDVKEREKTGLFVFGGGYSSVDNIVGFVSVEQTNFDIANWPSLTGGGQDLKFWLQIGSETQGYNLSFTEPYFRDRPIWLGPDFFSSERDWDEYTEKKTGLDIRAGRRFDRFNLGFTLKTENVKLSEVVIPSVQFQEGTRRANSLATSLDWRMLDSIRTPTRGFREQFQLEYAGGLLQGDLDFLRASLEVNCYRPLGRAVFHSKTYFAGIRAIGDTDYIPVYEKFYGGGIGTVRGYKERSLGPRDAATLESLGGNAVFAQNFELLYPIYQDILRGIVFFDAGNVWDEWEGLSDLRKGVGVGIRIIIPLLSTPLGLDYGIALNRDSGESRGRLHISMTFGF